MKSLVCLLASVRAASPFPLNCGSVRKRTSVEFGSNTARCLQITRGTDVKLMSEAAVPLLRKRDTGPSWDRTGRRAALSPYIPYTQPQSKAAALLDIQSLFEEDAIAELCSRLEAFPRNDRAEGLASVLGACVEFGLEAHSPPVLTLMNECLELLSNRDVGVAQLCRLGEVVCALEGRRSRVLTEVLDCVRAAVEEDVVSPSEAVMVYSLLARVCEPGSQQQTRILSALHTDTQRLVHRLKAGQVSDILQSLLKLQQTQAVSLVLRLSHRASRVFKAFRDDEIMKVLTALMTLEQHDGELVAAMEKHLPDVEICLDESGFVLPPSQWDHTYKRVVLCLDDPNRFCTNTRHLLGKEVTKRRHLQRMGVELVEIPYFEFEKLQTEEEQIQYLHDKIFPAVSKFNNQAANQLNQKSTVRQTSL